MRTSRNRARSHVAFALNELHYRVTAAWRCVARNMCVFPLTDARMQNYTKWGSLSLGLFMITRGRFVSVSRFVLTYLGFFVLLVLVVGVSVTVSMLK